MLALLGAASLAGGTCIACGATDSKFRARADVVSGMLLVVGLSMIGAMLGAYA